MAALSIPRAETHSVYSPIPVDQKLPRRKPLAALPTADTGAVQIGCVLLAPLDHQVEKTFLAQPSSVASDIVSVGPDKPSYQDGRTVIVMGFAHVHDRIHKCKLYCVTPVTDIRARLCLANAQLLVRISANCVPGAWARG